MEQAISYRIANPHRKPQTLSEIYESSVLADNIHLFLILINDPHFRRDLFRIRADTIFHYDALQIGIAMFNGQTKGIVDLEDVLVDGMTPLHLAAFKGAPRLTNYLLQRGDNVDTINSKLPSPIHLALDTIASFQKGRKSLFRLLYWLCHHNRRRLEVVRLLVQNTQDKECVKKAFIDYAHKGQLVHVAALFLAAPELFLSSSNMVSLGGGLSPIGMLYLILNSLEKKTVIEEEMSLLFDVFSTVGDKLLAYVRLEETSEQTIEQTRMEINFLLREVARKKIGVSSPDYYFRFYKPLKPEADHLSSLDPLELPKKTWEDIGIFVEEESGHSLLDFLPDVLKTKDIDQASIYRDLVSDNGQVTFWDTGGGGSIVLKIYSVHSVAARLNKAIDKKLSSMPTLNGGLENFATVSRMSEKRKKHTPQRVPFLSGRSFEPSLRSFSTSAASALRQFDIEMMPVNSWVNKMARPTKLKSVFSAMMLSYFPKVVRRFMK